MYTPQADPFLVFIDQMCEPMKHSPITIMLYNEALEYLQAIEGLNILADYAQKPGIDVVVKTPRIRTACNIRFGYISTDGIIIIQPWTCGGDKGPASLINISDPDCINKMKSAIDSAIENAKYRTERPL